MTLRIDISPIDVERNVRVMHGMGQRAQNLYVPFTYIADDFERVMARQFATQGASTGAPWRPLSDKWHQHKIDVGKNHGILQYNQALVESLTGEGPGSARDVRADSVTLGSTIWYGIFHVEGTRKMPRRNWMRIPANTRRHWVAVLNRYIMTGRLF